MRHADVQDADLLVIDGGHPIVQHGRPTRARTLSANRNVLCKGCLFDGGHQRKVAR